MVVRCDRLRHVLDEHSFSVHRWQDLGQVAAEANLIVNATGVGTWPEVDRSPWPTETRFLHQARASGARTISGLSLYVCEAALAFEKWTGYPPPIDVMARAAQEALAQQMPWGTPRPRNMVQFWPIVTSCRRDE